MVIAAVITFQTAAAPAQMIIAVNQVGYLPNDSKIAVISCAEPAGNDLFTVEREDGSPAFRGRLSADFGAYLAFAHNYRADFSAVREKGRYRIVLELASSPSFEINDDVYSSLPDSLLRFFVVQRCGPTSPQLHRECHLYDVTGVMSRMGRTKEKLDLTGGWHDAGDYIKFTITTSYAAYLLLLTAESFPRLSGPLLSEARIGLDWLMKMHPKPGRLLTQVQDISDHSVGWRLPEDDPLAKGRIACEYPSRAQAASFAAAMAIGSRLYRSSGDSTYAEVCLQHAKDAYLLAAGSRLSAADCPADSHYCDLESRDNIALAAAELFAATGEKAYLDSATTLLKELGAGGWVSWGDLEGFACRRLSPYWPTGLELLHATLERFNSTAAKNPYFYPSVEYPWGTLSLQTGIAVLALLYCQLTGDENYLQLATRQRDFLLGANPYSISMMSGVGGDWPRRMHHQTAIIKGVQLPGAVAGGLTSRKLFEKSGIQLETPDRFAALQSAETVFHDDRNDYLTNEPTISGNAQALFLISWFSSRAGR